ncbi:MAG: hypothetical protein ACREA0_22775, partial [bacterium]
MNTSCRKLPFGSLLAFVVVLGVALSTVGGASPPPFDFSDSFYLQNGINPGAILNRACSPERGPMAAVFDPPAPDSTRNDCRILET